MDKLHPGARWIFRVSAYMGLLFIVPVLGFMLSNVLIMVFLKDGNFSSFGLIIPLIILFFVMIAIFFGEIYARLAYNNWRYKFEDHALKLERGIIWKKYSNIPYERVQNVDVTRGILARLFGFSTVDVQTAGAAYAGRGGMKSEGHIPAVSIEHAEEIRNFLMHHISHKGGGGL